jgi:hypothetical protein
MVRNPMGLERGGEREGGGGGGGGRGGGGGGGGVPDGGGSDMDRLKVLKSHFYGDFVYEIYVYYIIYDKSNRQGHHSMVTLYIKFMYVRGA